MPQKVESEAPAGDECQGGLPHHWPAADELWTFVHKKERMVVQEKLVHMVVCAPRSMSREEVASFGHSQLCGTRNGWMLSEEKRIGRRKHPAKCTENKNRLHWVFYC